MESKYMTKATLIAVNKRAKKAGGNYIEPGFLELLPERFKFPVCKALPLPLERGWIRCWVTLGADDPIISENIRNLLLDMSHEVYDQLPVLREASEVGG